MEYTAKDLIDHINMLTPAQQQMIVDPSTDPLIKTLIFRIDLLLKDVEANKVADGKFVIGFKAFNKDLTCKGMQYEIGMSYERDEPIKLCKSGYHFCLQLRDVFKYYEKSAYTRVCVVKAWGNIEYSKEDSKCVTDHIQILRELQPQEYLEMCNKGFANTGLGNNGKCNTGNDNLGSSNTGSYNTGCDNVGSHNNGDRNVGNYNSGSSNVGNKNNGSRNVGDSNFGCLNIGHSNIGENNVGSHNCGNCNLGSYNNGFYFVGKWNSGFGFQTVLCHFPEKHNLLLFNKEITFEEYNKLIFPRFFFSVNPIEESFNGTPFYPKDIEHKIVDYKTAWRKAFDHYKASIHWEEEKETLLALPGFDFDIFEAITGITKKDIME